MHSNRGQRLKQSFEGLSRLLWLLPPPILVLLSIFSVQFGAATAKSLIVSLGAPGVVFLRTGSAALVLWLIARPQVRHYSGRLWQSAALLGMAMAAMNLAFYLALTRLPLGVTVTIEFFGPLAVALLGSRKLRDIVWVILAVTGLLLFAPLGSVGTLDPFGTLCALSAAVAWAAYIVLTARSAKLFTGITGLTLALTFSTIMLLPIGIASTGPAVWDVSLLLRGFVVGMLSTTIPFSLEFLALKRMPARLFGILVSAEPAVAALLGWLLLGEQLGTRELIALVCVSAATIGVTLMSRKRQD
jgi:inner membrane transporter RhtA